MEGCLLYVESFPFSHTLSTVRFSLISVCALMMINHTITVHFLVIRHETVKLPYRKLT